MHGNVIAVQLSQGYAPCEAQSVSHGIACIVNIRGGARAMLPMQGFINCLAVCAAKSSNTNVIVVRVTTRARTTRIVDGLYLCSVRAHADAYKGYDLSVFMNRDCRAFVRQPASQS